MMTTGTQTILLVSSSHAVWWTNVSLPLWGTMRNWGKSDTSLKCSCCPLFFTALGCWLVLVYDNKTCLLMDPSAPPIQWLSLLAQPEVENLSSQQTLLKTCARHKYVDKCDQEISKLFYESNHVGNPLTVCEKRCVLVKTKVIDITN